MKLTSTLGILVASIGTVLAQTPSPIPAPISRIAQAETPIPPPISGISGAPSEGAPTTGVTPTVIEPPVQPPSPAGTVSQVPPPFDSTTGAAAAAQGAPAPVTNPAAQTLAALNTGGSVLEFQGDEVGLVLRTLARQASMNVVVSPAVTGTVTMRLENMSPREAVDVICNANGLVIDELKNVYYIKTQAEKRAEPAESEIYTFSYANAEKVAPLVQAQISEAPQVDTRTNTIFFRVTKSGRDKLMQFLKALDKPTQQVMIEARLVEISANPRQAYGINWAGVVGGPDTAQSLRYGGSGPGLPYPNSQAAAITPQPSGADRRGNLNNLQITNDGQFNPTDFIRRGSLGSGFGSTLAGQFAILSLPQLSATLRLLNQDSDAEFLANPRIVTANNQKATIKITRAQPVPQLNFNEQTAQAVFSGFQDKEFGNSLVVTPSINKEDFITLMVQPEISNKVGDATFTFAGATVASPIIDKRTFESNVLIRSGDTLAIGGLLQDEQSKARTKVPVMGDIPLFGNLFSERINLRTKRNLLVFVTPTLINQGYGTGLEDQVTGLRDNGSPFADPSGWRNNAKGVVRLIPEDNRQIVSEYPKPGITPVMMRKGSNSSTRTAAKTTTTRPVTTAKGR